MHRELDNIKGLNKDSVMFKYSTKKKTIELKETEENRKSTDNQSNKKYYTLKRIINAENSSNLQKRLKL